MSVVTTPQDILYAAYAKSTKNSPGTIATESTELLQLVIRSLRGLYALAARVNPSFFATRQNIVSGDGITTALSLAKDAGVAVTFVTNGATSHFVIGGVAFTFNGLAASIFTAAHPITALHWGAILLQVSTASATVIGTKITGATQTTAQAFDSAADAVAALPAASDGYVAVGHILIHAGTTWTANQALSNLVNGAASTPCISAQMVPYAPTTVGWARPINAESVWRIESTNNTVPTTVSGSEVCVVPFDDKTAESGKPSVYEFGQEFYGAGNSLDPTSGTLQFFYSRRPTDPASLTATLDASWLEQFNEILILEVAAYLALKDGRGDEYAALSADKASWIKQYIMFLEHSTANERRRFAHVRRINTQTLVPLASFLSAQG
jgi:hypothetical protein